MMMKSHGVVVDYMTPPGLHHDGSRSSLRDRVSLVEGGRGRTGRPFTTTAPTSRASVSIARRAGSNAVAQYAPPVAKQFGDLKRVPEQFLLWFHHVPRDYRTQSGRILWDELVYRYNRGVDTVREMEGNGSRRRRCSSMSNVTSKSAGVPEDPGEEASGGADASIAYFQTFSKRPLPAGIHAARTLAGLLQVARIPIRARTSP